MKNQPITLDVTGHLIINVKGLEKLLTNRFGQDQPLNADETSLRREQFAQASSGEANFIDEKELSKRLHVCRRTLNNWRRSGKLPALKIGRRVLFHWPTVENALLRHQVGDF